MSRPRKTIVFKDPREDPKTANWRYRFKIPGAPELRGSTGTNDLVTAERIALQARQDLLERAKLGKAAPRSEWPVTEACAAYWLGYGRHQATGDKTIAVHLKHIERCLGPDRLLSAIGEADIGRMVGALRATTQAESRGLTKKRHPKSPLHFRLLSSATINRTLNTLCKMFDWMAANENAVAPSFSASAFHLQESEGREVFLSAEGGADFSGRIVAHAQPIVDLAFMTGLRKGNLIGAPVFTTGKKKGKPTGKRPLLCEQVRLDDPPHVTFITKTRSRKVRKKVHTVPLIPAAVALLRGLGVETRTGPVFLFGQNGCACNWCQRHAGEPIDNIKRSFNTARKAIGRPEFRIHDMRHSAASAILLKTGDLELARKLLGHTELKTTSRYAHLLQAHAAGAIDEALSGFGDRGKAGIKQGSARRKRA